MNMNRTTGVENRLPFPTRLLEVQGGTVEEFVIPESEKARVLKELYIFTPVPGLDDEMLDIHEGRTFRVRDYRVVRDFGMNMVVSPYYPSSGGTLIDWEPARRRRGR